MFWGLGDSCVKNASVDERDGGNRSLEVIDDDGVGWVIAFCLWSPDRFGLRSGGARRWTLRVSGAPHRFSKEGLLSMVYRHLELSCVSLAIADTFGGIHYRVFSV